MRAKPEILAWIQRTKIVPVIRASSTREALVAVEQMLLGGIDILEITTTVPGAVEVIREVVAHHGNSALVGAGTVYDPKTAEACLEAGAQFIVGPCFDPATVRFCRDADVLVVPGALTPTEIVTAWRGGADAVKVFPCDAAGGPSYLKSLKAPFPEIPLLPTGGVTLENLQAYVAAGAIAVGVGGNLVNLNLIREGREAELSALAAEFRKVAEFTPSFP